MDYSMIYDDLKNTLVSWGDLAQQGYGFYRQGVMVEGWIVFGISIIAISVIAGLTVLYLKKRGGLPEELDVGLAIALFMIGVIVLVFSTEGVYEGLKCGLAPDYCIMQNIIDKAE